MLFAIFKNCTGFDWDDSNKHKSFNKHNVCWWECEQIFFNKPILLYEDSEHSQSEQRFFVLGITDFNRHLFVVFTVRCNLIRVISARDMNKKERAVYEKAKDNPEI